jgi:hypothetical protein
MTQEQMTFAEAAKLTGDWHVSLLELDSSWAFSFKSETDLALEWESNLAKYGALKFFDVSESGQLGPDGHIISSVCKACAAVGDAAIVVGWKISEEETGKVISQEPTMFETLYMALSFYADPESYHATSFLFDPPCGEFQDDFSEVEEYERLMPGKRARAAMDRAQAEMFDEEAARPHLDSPRNTVKRAEELGLLGAKYKPCRHCAGTGKDHNQSELCDVCLGEALEMIPPFGEKLDNVLPDEVVTEFALFWCNPLKPDTLGEFIQRVAQYVKDHPAHRRLRPAHDT